MHLKSIQKCIYCGATDGALSDEHIVPFSLGGTWILPSASCSNCATITSRFERDISRGTYLSLRTRANFPTYHPKKRPKHFDAILIEADGSRKPIKLPTERYPTLYPVIHLPPPGILTGAPLRETNPEMRLELVGNQEELDALNAAYNHAQGFEFSSKISWGSLCRALAKIAHSFTIGSFGTVGYTQLLPPLILGGYSYLSNLVGGKADIQESRISRSSDGLTIGVDSDGNIVVDIDIMGGRLPTYSVVSGKVADWNLFMTNVSQTLREGKSEYSHSLKTRFGFNHDWAIEIVRSVHAIVERDFLPLKDHWPLLRGFSFDAYAVSAKHLLLVLKNSTETVSSGPDGQIAIKEPNHPTIPPQPHDLPAWREWAHRSLQVPFDQWPIIIPVHDSGKSNASADYELFMDDDKVFWDAQWQYLISTQYSYAIAQLQQSLPKETYPNP